jgi:hypothetical protein
MSANDPEKASQKKKEKKKKKGEKKGGHHMEATSPPPPAPINPAENELRRMTIWAHEILEDTDDPFTDDFADDVAGR